MRSTLVALTATLFLVGCVAGSDEDSSEAESTGSAAEELKLKLKLKPKPFPFPFPMLCGEQGEACCPPYSTRTGAVIGPEHCHAGLGCNIATGLCEAPCGHYDQVCCDGPDTNAGQQRFYLPEGSDVYVQTKDMCEQGVCSASSRRCEDCGTKLGGPCCQPGPVAAVQTCRGQLICSETLPGKPGVCEGCGGDGQQACSGDSCAPGTTARQGKCVKCGWTNQPACDGGKCLDGRTEFNGMCVVSAVANIEAKEVRTFVVSDESSIVTGDWASVFTRTPNRVGYKTLFDKVSIPFVPNYWAWGYARMAAVFDLSRLRGGTVMAARLSLIELSASGGRHCARRVLAAGDDWRDNADDDMPQGDPVATLSEVGVPDGSLAEARVTTLVSQWQRGTRANHGLVVAGSFEGYAEQDSTCVSEYFAPSIVVQYFVP